MTYSTEADEVDTLAHDLDKSIAEMKSTQPHYPTGHPIYINKGREKVEAMPSSPEAGYKHLPGHCGLQKM